MLKITPNTLNISFYKIPYDPKLVFLEKVSQGLYPGKVWENRFFFLSCMTFIDPYGKLLSA